MKNAKLYDLPPEDTVCDTHQAPYQPVKVYIDKNKRVWFRFQAQEPEVKRILKEYYNGRTPT
jgi:hypothetical protein